MSDDEHPELDFDPLDDTKTWPENDFPLRHVGRMQLNRDARELLRRVRADRVRHRRAGRRPGLLRRQDARRAHVLLLRHAAPPRRPELPAAAGQRAKKPVATNQRDGEMTYYVDETGENPSVNYEPSITGGLERDAEARRTTSQGPVIEGQLTRGADPAHATTTSRPASATCCPSSGSATTSSANLTGAARPVRPPDPGADGLAPVHDRGRARRSASATASASPPTTSAASRRWRRRSLTDEELARAREPRQQRHPRGRRARDDPLRAQRARVGRARSRIKGQAL